MKRAIEQMKAENAAAAQVKAEANAQLKAEANSWKS
jgi:hypothetical protein